MRANRRLSPAEEPVEFRPLPGQEGDWAGADYVPRDPVWRWLGIYPVAGYVIFLLVYMGMAAL